MEEKDKVTVVDTTPIEEEKKEKKNKGKTILSVFAASTVFLSLLLSLANFVMTMLKYENDPLQFGSIIQLLLFSIAITCGASFVKGKAKWVKIVYIISAVAAVAFIVTMMILGYCTLAENGIKPTIQ